MRRGLRLTSWIVIRDSGISVAATMNGAAEEKSPGTSTAAEPQALGRVDADRARPRRSTRAPAACSISSVWSRVGAGSITVVVPVGAEAGEQDGRLHLRARDRQLVVDRLERRAGDRQRQMPVGGLDLRAHPPQRLGDALHRPRRERLVAGQREGRRPGTRAARRSAARACRRCRSRSSRTRSPRRPTPCTVSSSPSSSTCAPSARTAASVDSGVARAPEAAHVASRRRRPRRAAARGARSTCRPGTAKCPSSRTRGLNPHRSTAEITTL